MRALALVVFTLAACGGRPLTVPTYKAPVLGHGVDGGAGTGGAWQGDPGAAGVSGTAGATNPFGDGGTTSSRCGSPGDPCCAGIEDSFCMGKTVCDHATGLCLACGGTGQPCCGSLCDTDLTCDHSTARQLGICSNTCGHQDDACCAAGECEQGTSCSTNDGSGTCRACGLVGIGCCRGDCWEGVCAYTDAPRICIACGLKGQPCCDPAVSGSACSDGSACDRAPTEMRGTCVGTCGQRGAACCRGGGCGVGLSCTTANEAGTCIGCGASTQPCCANDQCNPGNTCVHLSTGAFCSTLI
jgi:hypothetical protein